MNPDGLSYVDLASGAIQGGPAKLLNAYWSPGYPALIGAAMLLLRPAPGQEFPVVHLLNLAIFAFALWAFTYFFSGVQSAAPTQIRAFGAERRFLVPFAFGTFLYLMIEFIGMDVVTPDLAVGGMAFLATGMVCRMSLPSAGWWHAAALGVVLASGYYLKAAMFPLSLALLVLLLLIPPSAELSRRRILLSLLVFLALSFPLLAALSARTHRLTFGESGRLNYVWYVNRVHWTGGLENPEKGWRSQHPAPKLLLQPTTYVFASPIAGTYPLWFDPFYWYRDARATFRWRQQLDASLDAIRAYKKMALSLMPYFAGAVTLLGLLLAGGFRPGLAPAFRSFVIWPLSAFTMYAMVHVESRFTGAFFVLLLVGLYWGLMGRLTRQTEAAICVTVLLSVMAPFAFDLAGTTEALALGLMHPEVPEYIRIGQALRDAGLHRGDGIAIVGYANNCFYARYDRLRVVAQIPDAKDFWKLSVPDMELAAQKIAAAGAKAIVAFNRPDGAPAPGWREFTISDSLRLSVLPLVPTGVHR